MRGERNAGDPGGWQDEPDELLEEFSDEIAVGRALDLGMGEGRNALWLAARGFEVVGVDVSPASVESVQRLARERGLALETHVADIRNFEIEPASYSVILASAVLHFLMPAEIREIAQQIKAGLQSDGVVIAHAFTVDDPSYEARQGQRLPLVAQNTFLLPDLDGPLHYFGCGELRSLFDDLDVFYYAEERHIDTRHDDPHYHAYHAGAFLAARKSGD
ncbi:MAG: Tellurite methyltransferase [Anaerolineales bacterium]|nr:Tellurite methyltransferase [Anaerolineales bacterium]